jgi:hypothetical protein
VLSRHAQPVQNPQPAFIGYSSKGQLKIHIDS